MNGKNIQVTYCPEAKRKPKPQDSELGFGKYFTDHMFIQEYINNEWQTPQIVPYQNISLDPSALVLHYGQEIFEGMKAYPNSNGSVYLFRPHKNAQRFNFSARRMCMPEVDEELFIEAISTLVKIDKDWIPRSPGTSLYIRPTMIATEAALGVHPSNKYLFYVILSPVGPYFKEGFKPVKIYVASQHVRATPGGTGEAKTGGNYAATLYETKIAQSLGYSQVLWLDALERRFVEEVGAMNIMFVIDGEIYTPPLDGTILHGNTREAVLELAKDLGYKTHEEPIDINILVEEIKQDRCTEAFGTGTAASITPIGELYYRETKYVINGFEVGPITKHLYEELIGIQTGTKPDRFNWMYKIF
ncbi:MAG: branched-chain amino acid aminotransferase [Candidatus Heimdallarchaeaceae archaeon]